MNRKKVEDALALKHDVKTRITDHHLQRFQRMLAVSHYRTMSEMLRAILCEGEITLVTVDESLDVVMEELIALRKEISAIGNNLNQIARVLNSARGKGQHALQLVELVGLLKATGGKMDQLHRAIAALSKRWLQQEPPTN